MCQKLYCFRLIVSTSGGSVCWSESGKRGGWTQWSVSVTEQGWKLCVFVCEEQFLQTDGGWRGDFTRTGDPGGDLFSICHPLRLLSLLRPCIFNTKTHAQTHTRACSMQYYQCLSDKSWLTVWTLTRDVFHPEKSTSLRLILFLSTLVSLHLFRPFLTQAWSVNETIRGLQPPC